MSDISLTKDDPEISAKMLKVLESIVSECNLDSQKADYIKENSEQFSENKSSDATKTNFHNASINISFFRTWLFSLKEAEDLGQATKEMLESKESVHAGLYAGGGGDLMFLLMVNIKRLNSESRKDLSLLYKWLLKHTTDMVSYIVDRPELMSFLMNGYTQGSASHPIGSALRACVRNEKICKKLLKTEDFYNFFDYLQHNTFEIASDAFASFNLMLTKHKKIGAKHMDRNFDKIVKDKWPELLYSHNFATKRQSLKILRELLSDRAYYKPMMKFVSDVECLEMMIPLLNGRSGAVRLESFHLFKIFVLNPRKPLVIVDYLVQNRDSCMIGLNKLDPSEEQKSVITHLQALEKPTQEAIDAEAKAKAAKKKKKKKKKKAESGNKSSSKTSSVTTTTTSTATSAASTDT